MREASPHTQPCEKDHGNPGAGGRDSAANGHSVCGGLQAAHARCTATPTPPEEGREQVREDTHTHVRTPHARTNHDDTAEGRGGQGGGEEDGRGRMCGL